MDKYNNLETLPPELLHIVFDQLSDDELINLSQTSKYLFSSVFYIPN